MRAPGFRDLFLFVHGLRLAWRAQQVRRLPLPEVVGGVVATPRLPRRVGEEEAARAASRACRRLARWAGGLDTCLTRSLVAGALLADRPDVVLHVGFRPVAGGPADGHAWVTSGGRMVGGSQPVEAFATALTLELRRHAEGKVGHG